MTAALKPEHLDALAELINIGVGRAAAALSELVGTRIVLSVPEVRLCPPREFARTLQGPGAAPALLIVQEFEGALDGHAVLSLPETSGLLLAHLLSGVKEAPARLDLEMRGVLLEVGNIVLNAVMGSLANHASMNLAYHVPELLVGAAAALNLVALPQGQGPGTVLVADIRFRVERSQIGGSILVIVRSAAIVPLLESLVTLESPA